MDSSEAIFKGLKDADINFIVSVPCANLKKLLIMIDEDDTITHIPVSREEEGLGICAGAYMAGKKTAILMQNSGLGNCVNALCSLYELYSFPLVMIMSHRGTEGESIIGQVPMGRATPHVLEALNLDYSKPQTINEAYDTVKNSWIKSTTDKKPFSILLEIPYWKLKEEE